MKLKYLNLDTLDKTNTLKGKKHILITSWLTNNTTVMLLAFELWIKQTIWRKKTHTLITSWLTKAHVT